MWFPAIPSLGLLVMVVVGGPSPFLAEGPEGYSPPFPGWAPLLVVVSGPPPIRVCSNLCLFLVFFVEKPCLFSRLQNEIHGKVK